MTLQQAIFAGLVDPADLVIVRQIDDPTPAPGTVDTAVFSDVRANYDCITDGVLTSPCPLTSTGATTEVVHARGSGADGTDTIRNIERLQFGDVVAPPAPTMVTAVAGDAQATIGWKVPPGAVTGFEIETTNPTTGGSSVSPVDDPDATSQVVSGLTNGTSYTFRVRAINTAGAGGYSTSTDPVTPTVVVVPPAQPVLTSRLTRPVVEVGRHVAVTGTVAPFQGVTVSLRQDLPDGSVRILAHTTIDPSAGTGSFRFPVPTTASGLKAYHVTVTGSTIVTTTGPTLTLSVFRTHVAGVFPRGRESLTLQNTGRTVTQIGGWRLRDRVGKVLVLPSYSLAPGRSVRIFTGYGPPRPHTLHLDRPINMWFATHDTVHLYDDRGSPIATRRY